MTGVWLEIGPITGVDSTIAAEERRLEAQLVAGVEAVLDFAGTVQAESYTSTGNPAQPAGSTYTRTFALARSSEKKMTSKTLPIISGVWRANPAVARHAELVIGPRSQQAGIHRGRWKSEEDIEAEVGRAAPGIIQDFID